jgi:hypothetical protein
MENTRNVDDLREILLSICDRHRNAIDILVGYVIWVLQGFTDVQ